MNETKKTVLILYLVYVLAMAFLIYSIEHMAEPAEISPIEVTPIEYEVELPVQIGSQLEPDEVKVLEKTVSVDPDELDLLARLIQAEAGSDWCTDELQRAVGSVVLNRMNDSRYPDTMHDVIYQPGQYSTAKNGQIEKAATDRPRENAEYLLKNGSTIPEEIIFQANFRQGQVYKEIQGVFFGK